MQKDLEEMTPLHLATRHRSPKCLALLLKFMAPGEVDTQDKNKVIDSPNQGQIRAENKCFLLNVKPQGKRPKLPSPIHMVEQF